jgi:hypothetical protein
MRMLTEDEHEELLAAKRQRDALLSDDSGHMVESTLAVIESRGLVLTVEQQPLLPLAMGHYRTVYSLRAKRGT